MLSVLSSFFRQDIKKYSYYYWFAYPGLSFSHPESEIHIWQQRKIGQEFTDEQIKTLQTVCTDFTSKYRTGFFLLEQNENSDNFNAWPLSKLKDSKLDYFKVILITLLCTIVSPGIQSVGCKTTG